MSDEPTRTGRERGLSDMPTGQIRNPSAWTLTVAGQTDKGRVRPGNEDNFGVEPPTSPRARAHGTLLIVSDGMGGHAAGEVASALAVETVQADFYGNTGLPVADAIRHAITVANGAIYDSAQSHVEQGGMGCTIVVMVVHGNSLTVGHVGDSRGYLIRGGQARQITRDHSWVAMQVEEGVLTPEQAAHHPNRSLLMRALGRQESVEVEIGRHMLQDGDILIVCSDGLTGVVEDHEIAEYAMRLPPAAAAEQLIALANSRGAPDNVTVVAATLHASGAAAAAGNAPTIVAAPLDAPTPRLGQPADAGPTTRLPRGPSAEQAAVTTPLLGRAAPPGTPVVLSRESVVVADTLNARTAQRRYGRLLAILVAAIAVVVALGVLIYFPNNGPTESARTPEPKPAGTATPSSKPAATQQAAPGVSVPPPVATGLPGAAPAGTPTPTEVPTAQPTATVGAATPGLAAPGLTGTAAAIATRAAGAAPGVLPALAGTPLRPVEATPSPTATSTATPASGPGGASAPGGDRAGAGAPPPEGGSGDAPSAEETMAPADPSSAEPAPAEAPPPPPAAAPSGPGLTAPGSGFPAIPGFRPKVRSDDDD